MSNRSKTNLHRAADTFATCFAPAKVNLALHVTDQFTDGYHQLESLVAFCDIGDRIALSKNPAPGASTLSLTIKGPFKDCVPVGEENIIIRAVHAFAERFLPKLPNLKIVLEKNLPIASGIGGGSADAAATLLALRGFTGYGTLDELSEIAVTLGADVAMCLHSSPLMAKGRGEQVETMTDFPALNLLLVNPGIAVSTPQVFKALVNKSNPPLEALPEKVDQYTFVEWLKRQHNDLETPAIKTAPEVSDTLSEIRNTQPILARMSGSGATCFGIYHDADDAEAAADRIRKSHHDWWVQVTRTRNFGTERACPRA